MDKYLAFAKDLARQGGKLIKDNFEKDLNIEIKHDNSPVTQVDKAINDLIISQIQKTYPDHGVLGEEGDHGSGKEEFQWVCDPLDGTQCFILGIPHTTCVIGLVKNGEYQLSIIYNPYTDRLYHAVKGQGAFCNDEPIHVNDLPLKDSYILCENSTHPYVEALNAAGAKTEQINGAGYSSSLIAAGRAGGTIKGKYDFHDIGPSSLIVEEAGGRVTALDGSKLRLDQPGSKGIILSNGTCHDDLVKIASPL